MYFVMMAVASVAFASCEPNHDCPEIRFDLQQLNVGAEGGNLIIKVTSTGVDDVLIRFDNLAYDENGNLKPGEEWITLNEVIYDYNEDDTRALAKYTSGIDITVAPNTTGETRKARIYATSFTKTDTIEIIQSAE